MKVNGMEYDDRAIHFKVTPDILSEKSAEVSGKVNSVKRHFTDINELMDRTKGYWMGEAGDRYREAYYKLHNDLDEILEHLEEYPGMLLAIAQGYLDVEQKVQEVIRELPGDVVL